jgi:NAD(P)-dependent dehydrogenase (short-subunit alcohol dehydrogenase family)
MAFLLTGTAVVAGAVALAYYKAPARSFPTALHILKDVNLEGRVALVTGATSGIGVETARALAIRGAHVYLLGRSASKLAATKELLEKQASAAGLSLQLSTIICDLADLDSVEEAAKEFLKANSSLHILINNAGVMALPERQTTAQGLEMQVGVCHTAHFLLTERLLPILLKSATIEQPSRVVCLSSSANRFHNLNGLLETSRLETVPYDAWRAYGNAKASNLLHAVELQKRHAVKNVLAFPVMPGGIWTGLQEHVTGLKWLIFTLAGPFLFKSVEQGAATTVLCATTAAPETAGQYYDNCQPTETVDLVLSTSSPEAPAKLWQATETLLKDLGH